MTLTERLSEYVRACFTGLWIESHEHHDALLAIAQICLTEDWRLASWNVAEGLRIAGTEAEAGGSDPLAAIRATAQGPPRSVEQLTGAERSPTGPCGSRIATRLQSSTPPVTGLSGLAGQSRFGETRLRVERAVGWKRPAAGCGASARQVGQ